MNERPNCEVCGDPMPEGEEMFMFHGYSCPCPKPPLKKKIDPKTQVCAEILEIMEEYDRQSAKGHVDSPGGIEHAGDAFKLLAKWRNLLTEVK